MTMMISAPGIFELLIIGLMVLIPVAIVVAVVVAVAGKQKSVAPNPNLRPCPDCGRLVSLRAPSCPHCGRPLDPLQ